jgi:hypothetical protein
MSNSSRLIENELLSYYGGGGPLCAPAVGEIGARQVQKHQTGEIVKGVDINY